MSVRLKNVAVKFSKSQLIIPIAALITLVVFNIFRDISFFSVELIQNAAGNTVLSGNLMSILNSASELAIIAMGMTLVTAVSRGQDISVGAAAAIAGSVFVKIILSGQPTWGVILIAFLVSCAVVILFGAFNGTLVSIFKIQPMIATLILFTIGRSIAYWINGGATPTIPLDHPALYLGRFIPGSPIHTPIYIVIICALLFYLLIKFTSLGLYMQSVGINEEASRLNGINPVKMKLTAFIILSVCCAIAAVIRVGRLNLINHETILIGIEMDAILAVAIGGNSLGGGKFNVAGSVIGAYVIQALTTTLLAMRVPSTDIQAYKALVIIIIVVVGSPVFKRMFSKLWNKAQLKKV